jgi:D-aminoacyl-tRNA deacylase
MVCLIYSADQATSVNIAEALKGMLGFEEAGAVDGMDSFKAGKTRMLEVHGGITDANFVGGAIGDDLAIFLSMHSSGRGIAAFTVHAEGNWGSDAKLGGMPKRLSTASPHNMCSMLNALHEKRGQLQATYEATHHGPLLDAPSFFVEVGGTDEAMNSKLLAETLAAAVADFLSADKAEYGKVAIGIGGTHYPEKFTRLALDGTYAFSHIMPKYALCNDMLQQAVERSEVRAETAVIEWKSLNAEQRAGILQELEKIGVDYEKV